MIDISIPLRAGTPEWPGDAPYACGWTARIGDGASVNLSWTSGSPHVGTHADAPLHVQDGRPGSDALPPDAFMGPVLVVDVSCVSGREISCDDIADALTEGAPPRLLLRTGRSIADGRFPDDWPVLSRSCVSRLVRGGLRLLGVDAPSVDGREDATLPVHHALFDGGAFILENLDLRFVTPGGYELVAAPLRLEGLDAAPVRALLRTGAAR